MGALLLACVSPLSQKWVHHLQMKDEQGKQAILYGICVHISPF